MSELSKFEITIILPTLNEGENLKFLLVDFGFLLNLIYSITP